MGLLFRGHSITPRQIEVFWSKVDKTDNCWLWIGKKNNYGYGRFVLRHRPTIAIFAHRLSWMIDRGEIDTGKLICHKCDTPNCVNPSHLFIGTQSDNLLDASKKRRLGQQTHPENFGGKPLSERHRKAISAAKTGEKRSEETKEKLRILGRKHISNALLQLEKATKARKGMKDSEEVKSRRRESWMRTFLEKKSLKDEARK